MLMVTSGGIEELAIRSYSPVEEQCRNGRISKRVPSRCGTAQHPYNEASKAAVDWANSLSAKDVNLAYKYLTNQSFRDQVDAALQPAVTAAAGAVNLADGTATTHILQEMRLVVDMRRDWVYPARVNFRLVGATRKSCTLSPMSQPIPPRVSQLKGVPR